MEVNATLSPVSVRKESTRTGRIPPSTAVETLATRTTFVAAFRSWRFLYPPCLVGSAARTDVAPERTAGAAARAVVVSFINFRREINESFPDTLSSFIGNRFRIKALHYHSIIYLSQAALTITASSTNSNGIINIYSTTTL
jgi:hypothetical protein